MRLPMALFIMIWSIMLTLDARAQPMSIEQIAPGIYLHSGKQEDAFPYNRGDIANLGFIVGKSGVAVIDTGGSPFLGDQLKQAIRSVTDLPIKYVINTHVHPDHILGDSAFTDQDAVFVGSARLPGAMQGRGPFYLNRLPQNVGPDDAKGAAIVLPTQVVDGETSLDLGDRTIVLKSWPTAHTDNDLTVWDPATKTLWASDLLFVNRIPVLDGNLSGWLSDLDGLAAIPASQVVPGHGPLVTEWPAGLADQRRYLTILRDEVRAVIARHGTMEQAMDGVGQGEKGKWLLFGLYNRRNVSAAFAELEWE